MDRPGMKEVGLLCDGFFRWDVQYFPGFLPLEIRKEETRVGKK